MQPHLNSSIITTIIGMAQNLNLNVIAEGLETEQQLLFLRKHDCDQAQGFYFSKPCYADEFINTLEPLSHANLKKIAP